MSEFDGLCNSDWIDRNDLSDHWEGSDWRITSKGRVSLAWNHVSPSQIENFQKCKRSWLFKSILKIPEAQKGHQALGSSFHLILEKVPKGLGMPNHADTQASPEDWAKAEAMAKIALPLLPVETPDRLFKREHGLRLETYSGGPTMIGYVDLGIPAGVGWPAFMFPANEAIVADYKTLSDYRYMKTPEELANSIQMMTYAKWAISEWPSGLHGEKDPMPDYVRLLHMYARTKAPFNRSSIRHESALVTPDQINKQWDKTLDIVREMQQLSSCTDPDQAEAGGALNGHCEAYGGCTYRDKCGISKQSGIKSLFQISKKPTQTEPLDMSGSAILDKIKAARMAAGAPTPPATAPAVTPSAPVSPVVDAISLALEKENSLPVSTMGASIEAKPAGPISGLMAKILAQGKGSPSLGGSAAQAYGKEHGNPTAQGYAGAGDLAIYNITSIGELMKLASGVVPPDAPPRTQAVITQPGQVVVDPLALPVEGEEDGLEDSEAAPVVATPATPSVSGAVSVESGEPVAKRGRPSKEVMAAREAAEKAKFDAAVLEAAKTLRGADVLNMVDSDMKSQIEALKVELAQAQIKASEDRKFANNAICAEVLANARIKELEEGKGISTAPAQDGLTLYVDTFPVKGEKEQITDFFEWIGPICRAVAQTNSVEDYRLINYTAKGLLAGAIRTAIKAEGLPKAMTISTYAGGSDIALEILTPLAKRIIKKI